MFEEREREREFSEEESLYADLYEKNGMCYDITYTDDDDEEVSESWEFIEKYKENIEDIISDLKSGLTDDLFDSVQVQLISGDKHVSTNLIQDALRYECLEQAIDSDGGLCTSSQNIIHFGLTQDQTEAIYVDVNNTRTVVPINDVKSTLGFSRTQKIESITPVKFDPEEFDHKGKSTFVSLFSVIFSLDQLGTINKQINLVQDIDPKTQSIDLGNITDISSFTKSLKSD